MAEYQYSDAWFRDLASGVEAFCAELDIQRDYANRLHAAEESLGEDVQKIDSHIFDVYEFVGIDAQNGDYASYIKGLLVGCEMQKALERMRRRGKYLERWLIMPSPHSSTRTRELTVLLRGAVRARQHRKQ